MFPGQLGVCETVTAMKKLLTSILAIALAAFSASAQYVGGNPYTGFYDSDCVRALKEHVGELTSAQMEGRKAGSEGEWMAADYLEQVLKVYGVDVLPRETFGIAKEGADTLRSCNVVGLIQGSDPALNKRYIVIGARMDGMGMDSYMLDGERVPRIYPGAVGNASGVAMLLELGRMLATNALTLRRSVLLVGFGATAESMAGSWYFLNRAFGDAPLIDAMINLDMLGVASHGLLAYTSSNADMNALVRKMESELLPLQAKLVAEEPYPGDHRAFYAAEIPSVLFTTGRYPEHDSARDNMDLLDFESMERMLEYIFNFTVTTGGAPAPAFRPGANTPTELPPRTVSFFDCDVKPAFMGSYDPRTFMEKWVYEYLRYPSYAVQNGIQGRVVVDFIIDEKGNVTDARVTRSVHESLDAEALRVIEASPKWKPGKHRGKKARVAMSVTVEFRLSRKSDGSFGVNGIKVN